MISAVPSKGKVRITFVCGGRAERMFRLYMQCAHKAGNVLSCPVEKLASNAGELKARLADAERRVNRYETERILEAIRQNEDAESLKGITLSVTDAGGNGCEAGGGSGEPVYRAGRPDPAAERGRKAYLCPEPGCECGHE